MAVADDTGWPLATLLASEPGFVSSPDPDLLRIAALPAPGDPAHACLAAGAEIGLVGIDLSTRRRNRANGVIKEQAAAWAARSEAACASVALACAEHAPKTAATIQPREGSLKVG